MGTCSWWRESRCSKKAVKTFPRCLFCITFQMEERRVKNAGWANRTFFWSWGRNWRTNNRGSISTMPSRARISSGIRLDSKHIKISIPRIGLNPNRESWRLIMSPCGSTATSKTQQIQSTRLIPRQAAPRPRITSTISALSQNLAPSHSTLIPFLTCIPRSNSFFPRNIVPLLLLRPVPAEIVKNGTYTRR